MGSPSLYSSVGAFVFEAGATASHDLAIEVLRAVGRCNAASGLFTWLATSRCPSFSSSIGESFFWSLSVLFDIMNSHLGSRRVLPGAVREASMLSAHTSLKAYLRDLITRNGEAIVAAGVIPAT
jgi:hypothetical protein